MPVDTLDWAENDESDGRALRIFDSPAAPWPPCNRAHTTPDGEKKNGTATCDASICVSCAKTAPRAARPMDELPQSTIGLPPISQPTTSFLRFTLDTLQARLLA